MDPVMIKEEYCETCKERRDFIIFDITPNTDKHLRVEVRVRACTVCRGMFIEEFSLVNRDLEPGGKMWWH